MTSVSTSKCSRDDGSLMGDSIPNSPTFIALFGNCGSMLVQQIHYWCRKNRKRNRNYKNGEYWCYNTYTQWEKELQGFDTRSIRRTVDELRKIGVLVTDNFNKKAYDKTLWYRINYDKLDQQLWAYELSKANPTAKLQDPNGQIAVLTTATMATPIPESSTENTTEKEASASPSNLIEEPPPKTIGKGNDGEDGSMLKKNVIPKGTVKKTASEVSKMFGNDKANLANVTSTGMGLIWKKTVPQYNDSVKFVGEFTMKQRHQFVLLSEAWGKEEAGRVLQFNLMFWGRFSKTVGSQAGLKATPLAPNLDFLLKHRDVAMSVYISSSNEEKKALQAHQEAYEGSAISTPTLGMGDAPKLPTHKGKIIFKKKGYEEPVQLIAKDDQVTAVIEGTEKATVEKETPITLQELLELHPVGKYNVGTFGIGKK